MSDMPTRSHLTGTPSNAQANAAMGKFYDYVAARVGTPNDVSGGAFYKADSQTVAFTKTANATASLKAGTWVDVGGQMLYFAGATNIVMPALTAGTDYAIYACTDNTVRADASFVAPTGYTALNSRRIGGFHYAPGGHSGAPGGGNATPQINQYSFWDLKFRPAATDPRGMCLVADSFWADIYLLGVDHQLNGTSKYNVTIADGVSSPKIPTKFGGNGSTAYGSLSWWQAAEVGQSFGKSLPTYDQFAALAYGTTENSSIGSDPGATSWAPTYVSKWGVNQASGCLWIWGAEFSYSLGDGVRDEGWKAEAGFRGNLYLENDLGLAAAWFGGSWDAATNSGSRAAHWSRPPWSYYGGLGARFIAGHFAAE